MPTVVTYENLKKCRLLRNSGYSDDDLLRAGFDPTTVARSFTAVTDRNAVKHRCKTCGRLFYRVNRAGDCLPCEMEKNSDRLALVKSSILPKKNSHPDILG